MLLVCLGSLVVRLSWVKEGENNRQSELFGKEKMEREREGGRRERETERGLNVFSPSHFVFDRIL